MGFTTDGQTLNDLNIFGKAGASSVYQVFNRCQTRGGAVLLEEMFRYPLSDGAAINRRCGILQYFTGRNMHFPFSAADIDAAEIYLSNTDERTKLSAQTHSALKRLSNLVAVDAETVTIHKGISALHVLLHGVRDLVEVLEDAGRRGADGTGKDAYAGERDADGTDRDAYAGERDAVLLLLGGAAFVPVLCQPVTRKMSVGDLAACDLVFRFRMREEVRGILRFIYYLDVYISVARVAVERGLCFPLASPATAGLVLDNVYHPMVKNAVGNSVVYGPEGNMMFLTGANMAGKSTFMKALGIALYLAHMGFPVAAARMVFPVLDGIYTTINLPDDLGMGVSHFYAEVLRAKKVAMELSRGRNLFIVFDELFRGTNVKDACEATIVLAEGFARKRNSLFVISTHIIEAGDVLQEGGLPINFVYLPTRMDGARPVYTYKLEKGITADRHGMIIINNEGILEILQKGEPKFSKKGKL